jgi:hypothetical protein
VTVEQVKGQDVNGGPFGFDHAAVSVNGQQAVGLEQRKDTGTVVEDKTVPGAVRAVDPNREVKDKATIQVTPEQAGKIQTFLDNSRVPCSSRTLRRAGNDAVCSIGLAVPMISNGSYYLGDIVRTQ